MLELNRAPMTHLLFPAAGVIVARFVLRVVIGRHPAMASSTSHVARVHLIDQPQKQQHRHNHPAPRRRGERAWVGAWVRACMGLERVAAYPKGGMSLPPPAPSCQPMSSTSNVSVELAGITPPIARLPYAYSGAHVRIAFSPLVIVATPRSHLPSVRWSDARRCVRGDNCAATAGDATRR